MSNEETLISVCFTRHAEGILLLMEQLFRLLYVQKIIGCTVGGVEAIIMLTALHWWHAQIRNSFNGLRWLILSSPQQNNCSVGPHTQVYSEVSFLKVEDQWNLWRPFMMRLNKLPEKQSMRGLRSICPQMALGKKPSFCYKTKMLMDANSEGCCCWNKEHLSIREEKNGEHFCSVFLMISLEKWFLDLCVCCFVTSQTVIILFVFLPHWCSTHNKCVCRPVWIMTEGFWLSYLALVKQQAATRLLPTTSVSLF